MYQLSKEHGGTGGQSIPPYDDFDEKGIITVEPPNKPVIMLSPFRNDPDAAPLRTPSGKIELFSETIDSFGYDNCPGHPTWMEPSEWLGSANRKSDQYHLISNQPTPRLHSQFDCGKISRRHKVKQREPLRMNPEDAASNGISDGDTVVVYNDRGSFYATTVFDKRISVGVLQIATGAWFDPQQLDVDKSPCKHGNPNLVTHDRGTSRLAQGPAAMSCLVRIEKASAPAPEVTAFLSPNICPAK